MTKITDLSALAGAGVNAAADLLPIVDDSEAGTAKNKKIVVSELRIGMGLGTADSPQFTGINLGHASDTTITRVSAGVIAVEGVNIVTTSGGVTFGADISVPAEAYGAGWNGSNEVPTKNDIYDKIETLSAGGAIEVLDEGVSETAALVSLDFVGAGVTANDDGLGNVIVTIAGGGGSGIDVEDEGVAEATGATILNFTGAGVTATDVGGGQVDVAIPGGGAGWVLTDSWTHSVNVANVAFTGLAGATDILIIADGVVSSVSGVPLVQVSTNNGSSYYTTSGDYKAFDSAGASVSTTGFSLAGTNSTGARSGIAIIHAANVTGAPRACTQPGNSPGRTFNADNANDIDAIRVAPSGGGNFTAGSLYVFTR